MAPRALEEVPAGQSEHELEPAVLAYLPGTQYEHALGDAEPATAEYVPKGHGEHATAPAAE